MFTEQNTKRSIMKSSRTPKARWTWSWQALSRHLHISTIRKRSDNRSCCLETGMRVSTVYVGVMPSNEPHLTSRFPIFILAMTRVVKWVALAKSDMRDNFGRLARRCTAQQRTDWCSLNLDVQAYKSEILSLYVRTSQYARISIRYWRTGARNDRRIMTQLHGSNWTLRLCGEGSHGHPMLIATSFSTPISLKTSCWFYMLTHTCIHAYINTQYLS